MATPKFQMVIVPSATGTFTNQSNDYLLVLGYSLDSLSGQIGVTLSDPTGKNIYAFFDGDDTTGGANAIMYQPSRSIILIPPGWIFASNGAAGFNFMALQGSLEDLRGYL